jgi:transcription-repair coupling factor (superfamily II helicase)
VITDKTPPPIFGAVLDALSRGADRISVTGLWGSSKALFLRELAARSGRGLLVVSPTPKESEALYSDYRFFHSQYGPPPEPANKEGAGSSHDSHEAGRPAAFPPWDVLPYDVMDPDPAVVAARLTVLRDIYAGEATVVFAPVRAVMQRLAPPDELFSAGAVLRLVKGAQSERDGLLKELDRLGFSRAGMVYEPGEFSVRGGIVDIFPPGTENPVRVEFFGDTVESLRAFDPDTQRSVGELDEIVIMPAREFTGPHTPSPSPIPHPEGAITGRGGISTDKGRGGLAGLIDYFPVKPVVVLEEPDRVFSQAGEFEARVFAAYEQAALAGKPHPEELYIPAGEIGSMAGSGACITVESLPIERPDSGAAVFRYHTRSVEGLRLRDSVLQPWPEEIPKTPIAIFCRNLKDLIKGRAVCVVCPTQGQAERLREIFAEYGLPGSTRFTPGRSTGFTPAPHLRDSSSVTENATCESGASGASEAAPAPHQHDTASIAESVAYERGVVQILIGELQSGFVMDGPGLAFITATEVFGEKPRRAPAPRAKVERFLTSLSELGRGDFVVHVEHGIGRYDGLKRLTLLGVQADFLELVYAGGDRLYVPVDELAKVQKYIGAESAAPALDRLGGVAWEKAKARASKAVREMAKELIELYAARAVAPGFAYSPDDHLYREMEASFEYEETPDQGRTMEEVKRDLEEPHPMDRLICGDVGYGKTEVAIRAAFKVVMDGKQAAVLVPTTLLASQHTETFSSRLAAFPVKVEMLSRFTPKAHVKDVVKGLKDGTVDIVIGTHRLLGKDVSFKDLGLLVIDEEHRFGVAHKEKLKAMRKQVDVLTLTATPIPRTLNMSLSGIRDLSIIETPPPDRQPIKTIVTRFDKDVVREAVLREISRGGQVFFVHNRIESIFKVAELVTSVVPEARIAVAHGRMREAELEEVMTKFITGQVDLLLTTSIIESGLDIPAANTIIIDRADRFGLADLYQLRGRVGRSGVRAYAYLLVPGEDTLTETARKRLRVLSELTELGAGFKLALHDLEIRGAGNILGAEQSGNIAAVGFELYTQLLEDAVRELKGEAAEEKVDPALDLKVSAYIPDAYVPDTAHRLGIYKRLAGAASLEEVADLKEELADRYGPIPEPAARLVEVMEIKVLARALKVGGIQLLPSEVKITFTSRVSVSPDKLIAYLGMNRGRARYVPQYTIFIKRPAGGWDDLRAEIKNCLKELA